MSMETVKEIEAEALKLSPRARARLAERLLQSLESLSEEENDAIWLEEAQQRNEKLDIEDAVMRPSEEVFREVRSSLFRYNRSGNPMMQRHRGENNTNQQGGPQWQR